MSCICSKCSNMATASALYTHLQDHPVLHLPVAQLGLCLRDDQVNPLDHWAQVGPEALGLQVFLVALGIHSLPDRLVDLVHPGKVKVTDVYRFTQDTWYFSIVLCFSYIPSYTHVRVLQILLKNMSIAW